NSIRTAQTQSDGACLCLMKHVGSNRLERDFTSELCRRDAGFFGSRNDFLLDKRQAVTRTEPRHFVGSQPALTTLQRGGHDRSCFVSTNAFETGWIRLAPLTPLPISRRTRQSNCCR